KGARVGAALPKFAPGHRGTTLAWPTGARAARKERNRRRRKRSFDRTRSAALRLSPGFLPRLFPSTASGAGAWRRPPVRLRGAQLLRPAGVVRVPAARQAVHRDARAHAPTTTRRRAGG